MNITKLFLMVGVVFLVVGVGAAVRYYHEDPADNPSGSPIRPQAGSVSGGPSTHSTDGVVCTGFVDLEHGIRSLSPLRPGRVAAVLVKESQHVDCGAAILRLDDRDAKYQLEAAESAVTTAEIQLEDALKMEERQRARLVQQQAAIAAAGFHLDAARQMLQRREKQFESTLVSSEEVEMARAEVNALAEQEKAERAKLAELQTVDPALAVRKAKASLKLSQITRDRANHGLGECTLKAPTAGTVQRIAVGAGDIVSGNPAQSIVRFCPEETPLIRAEVDQEFAERVAVGQSALIQDDTHTGASWRGKVQSVAGWYERRRPMTQDPSAYIDVRTVECLIAIDPGQAPLRIGQRMRVMIGRVPSSGGD